MLDTTYEEIYDYNTEPGSSSREFAAKALKWMLCAQRPLSITELAEAVGSTSPFEERSNRQPFNSSFECLQAKQNIAPKEGHLCTPTF